MTEKLLNILVVLRESIDPGPPVRLGAEGEVLSSKGLRMLVNPADLCALEHALELADGGRGCVTALSIGPRRCEDQLRLALAMGAHRALRVWDESLEHADTLTEAWVLARICAVVEPDLVFSGHRLLDRGADGAPALAAALGGTACVGSAVECRKNPNSVEVLRRGDKGARQRVAAAMPCTVLFDDGTRQPRYPHHQRVTDALESPIDCWGLDRLGLAGAPVPWALHPGRFRHPRPNPVRVETPDAGLPAFERILSLLSGGIKPRQGRVHEVGAQETVKRLMKLFQEQGLLEKASP